MKSGRSTRSGSVVYSSRTKRVNELPVTLSSSSRDPSRAQVGELGPPFDRRASTRSSRDAVIVVRAAVEHALHRVEAQLASAQLAATAMSS